MSFPRTAVFLFALGALWGCGATSRIIRPELSGFVYDAEPGKPLRGCQVGETSTDERGYFMLPRKSYPKTSFSMGGNPPFLISEYVVFPGYEMVRLHSFRPWGVSRLSSHWELKPIFLRKLDGDDKTETDPPWRRVPVHLPALSARKDSPSLLPK